MKIQTQNGTEELTKTIDGVSNVNFSEAHLMDGAQRLCRVVCKNNGMWYDNEFDKKVGEAAANFIYKNGFIDVKPFFADM